MSPALQRLVFFITLASTLSTGVYIQNNVLFNWDVSWLMHASERLLAGGTYTKDFLEINPPLILYLYALPVWFAKFFNVSFIFSLRLFVIFLSSISLILSFNLLKQIASYQESFLIIFLLSFIFFILPIEQFGQREHLLVIFSMPYFILIACRSNNKEFNNLFPAIIGFLAGLGFALKPYFFIPFFLVEIYYACIHRQQRQLIRPESLMIAGVVLLYSILILSFHRDYLTNVLPVIKKIYYYGVSSSLINLATYQGILTCYFACFLYFSQCKFFENKLFDILFLVIIGFLSSYFLQHTIWYYHFYPALSISLLLITLLLNKILSSQKLLKKDYIFFILLIIMIAACRVYFQTPFQVLQIFHTKIFFGSIFILFTLLYINAQNSKNIIHALTIGGFVTFIGYLLSFVMISTDFYNYQLSATLLMVLILFLLLVPSIKRSKQGTLVILILIISLFSYFIFFISFVYDNARLRIQSIQGFLTFMHKHAFRKKVYIISESSFYAFPITDYAGFIPAMRWQFSGWITSIFKREKNNVVSLKTIQIKKFYLNTMVEDINQNMPAYILVDKTPKANQINYLNYLMNDVEFKTAWRPYKYLISLNEPGLYQFDVYERSTIS